MNFNEFLSVIKNNRNKIIKNSLIAAAGIAGITIAVVAFKHDREIVEAIEDVAEAIAEA